MPAKSETQKRYRECCFTSFRCEEINWWHDWTEDQKSPVSYMIIQGELTEEHKRHIQGYAQFNKQMTLQQIKAFYGDNGLHVEPRYAKKAEQAIEYCKQEKHGVWHEYAQYGQKKEQGKRTDLVALRDKIKSGKTVKEIIFNTENEKELNLCVKYERVLTSFEKDVYEKTVKAEIMDQQFATIVWNPWQKSLLEEIEQPIDTRKVIWYYDQKGNSGKSYLTEYLMCKKQIYHVTGGKTADILYGYDNQQIIVYDLSRTCAENMKHLYHTMENFKNGSYLSTKFESRQRIFRKPIIIVMANVLPDLSALSHDRWDIREITPEKTADKIVF